MINYIWFGMIALSVVCATVNGRLPELSQAVMDGAGDAVELSIFLLGSMCAWLGFLKIAERAGLTSLLARGFSPIIDRLFPDYRGDEEIKGKICMNISANLLGLGNAATPLGLSAMKAMAEKSPGEEPSRGMVLFVVINTASLQLLPVIIGVILLFGFFKGVDVFDAFVLGAKEGIHTTLGLLPTLIGLIVAVSMVRASGLLDALCALCEPLANAAGISTEVLPLALLRPISGSGSSAYTLSLLEQFGPDSETGKIASVLASSTETTFYAVTVYFGAVGCKKLRHTLPAALAGDCMAVVLSVVTVKFLAGF